MNGFGLAQLFVLLMCGRGAQCHWQDGFPHSVASNGLLSCLVMRWMFSSAQAVPGRVSNDVAEAWLAKSE